MVKSLRSPEYDRFVALLKATRQKAGMTQQTLADLLQKPQSYVAKIEGGERRIDIIEFVELSKALNSDPVQILRRFLTNRQ